MTAFGLTALRQRQLAQQAQRARAHLDGVGQHKLDIHG